MGAFEIMKYRTIGLLLGFFSSIVFYKLAFSFGLCGVNNTSDQVHCSFFDLFMFEIPASLMFLLVAISMLLVGGLIGQAIDKRTNE